MAMSLEIRVLEVLGTVGYYLEGVVYIQHHYTVQLRHHLFLPDLLYEHIKGIQKMRRSLECGSVR